MHVFLGCLDKKRVCDPWARLGFCESRRSFMKKHCPQRCDLCYGEMLGEKKKSLSVKSYSIFRVFLEYKSIFEYKRVVCTSAPPEAGSTPTPPPANVKIKMVPRGKVVGFRCGTKNTKVPPKVR